MFGVIGIHAFLGSLARFPIARVIVQSSSMTFMALAGISAELFDSTPHFSLDTGF
jgi:hypothetical protein